MPANSPLQPPTHLPRYFQIGFRNHYSPALPYDVSGADVETALEALYSIGDVTVTLTTVEASGYTAVASSQPFCSAANVAFVEFRTEFGDLPPLRAKTTKVRRADLLGDQALGGPGTFSVKRWRRGTKEHVECAAVGLCDRLTGACACLEGHFSSNGSNAYGNRGDCGFRHSSTELYRLDMPGSGGYYEYDGVDTLAEPLQVRGGGS